MDLARDCHEQTRRFPSEERFGLTDQMRRASYSIPSNIAEGCGRGSDLDFRRFLRMAYGSSCELETQARLAVVIEIATEDQMDAIIDGCSDVRRMLGGLIHRTSPGQL
jgi:four helix bundle protein